MIDQLKRFFSAREPDEQVKTVRGQRGNEPFRGHNARKHRCFESDYNSATSMLKERMNSKFPDNFHAKLGSSSNNAYDYGAARINAVDRASTAISLALRNGATVHQAAEAGAASVGI